MQQTSKSVSLTARLESVVHTEKLIWGVSMAFALYLVASPIAMLIFGSLRSTKEKLPFEATRFTFENYIRVFTSSATYELFLNSLWFAAGSIILCTFLSVALAWLLERTDVPWRPFLMAIVIAPMGLPGIVNALSWILLANPNNGWINVLLRGLLGVGSPGPLNLFPTGPFVRGSEQYGGRKAVDDLSACNASAASAWSTGGCNLLFCPLYRSLRYPRSSGASQEDLCPEHGCF
jgi:ABC-type spermidine/putrescine transport system permease subunit I